jgi:hypothetical protein
MGTVEQFPGLADGESPLSVVWAEGRLSVDGVLLDAETADRLVMTLINARRAAFGQKPPAAAIVEILETGDREIDETGPGTLILPRDVRINGVSVYTSGGVRVHEMEISPPKEMPVVTLTLPVRLLIVGAESDSRIPAGTRQP